MEVGSSKAVSFGGATSVDVTSPRHEPDETRSDPDVVRGATFPGSSLDLLREDSSDDVSSRSDDDGAPGEPFLESEQSESGDSPATARGETSSEHVLAISGSEKRNKGHRRSKSSDISPRANEISRSESVDFSTEDSDVVAPRSGSDEPSQLGSSKKMRTRKGKKARSKVKSKLPSKKKTRASTVRRLWRDFERLYETDNPSDDPLADELMTVPADIVHVKRHPRFFNTASNGPASSILEFKGILPGWMKSILHFYTSDYVYVNYGDSSIAPVVPSPRSDRGTMGAASILRGRQTIQITAPGVGGSTPAAPEAPTVSSPKKTSVSRKKHIGRLRPSSPFPAGKKSGGKKSKSNSSLDEVACALVEDVSDADLECSSDVDATPSGSSQLKTVTSSPKLLSLATDETPKTDEPDSLGSMIAAPGASLKERTVSKRNMTLNSPVYIDEAVATEKYSEERYTAAEERRRVDRTTLFLDTAVEEATAEEERIEPFVPPSYLRILVAARHFEFECPLPQYEPLFCSIAIYDVQKRVKLGETFHFEHNEFIRPLLVNTCPNPTVDDVTTGLRAIFHFQDPNPHVFIIMKVSRLMWPDMDKEDAFYFKPKSLKAKAAAKAEQAIEEFLTSYPYNKTGPMRVPFCWGYTSLFQTMRRGVAREGDITIDNFHHLKNPITDEEMLELILSDKGDKKKAVCMTYTLNVMSIPFDDLVENVVDTNLEALKPTNMEVATHVRDMPSFLHGYGARTPFVSYKNNVYLYPDLLTCKLDKSAQNIMLEVRLKDSDKDLESGLCGFFGRCNCPSFVEVGVTCLSRHAKQPQFADEIKAKLPLVLTSQHHLLFTILAVSANPKKGAHTVVGYAVLPLYFDRSNLAIRDGVHSLVVHNTLSPGYLSTHESEESFICYSSDVAHTLSVGVRLDSTVYPDSPKLVLFFDAVGSLSSETADRKSDVLAKCSMSLDGLEKVGIEDATQYFPAILHGLLRLLTLGVPDDMKKQAVIALVSLLKRVCGRDAGNNKNPILYSYVHFVFDVPGGLKPETALHVALCKLWVLLLKENHGVLDGFHASWFLLEVMVKSMALHLEYLDLLKDDNKRAERFPTEFTLKLRKLIDILFSSAEGLRNLEAITFLPVFLRKLLNLIDRGVVFEMVYTYMKNLPESQLFGRFKFLRALVQYEHYLPISRPLPATDLASLKLNSVIKVFWRKHFLPGLVVNETKQALEQSPAVRAQCHLTLRSLLRRTHQGLSPPAVLRATSMYFPVVLLLLDQTEHLLTFAEEEQREWLLCWLSIARHCQPQLRSSWWTRDTPQRLQRFLRLLRVTVDLFEEFHRFDTAVGHAATALILQTHQEVCLTVLDLLMAFLQDVLANLNNMSASVTDTGVVAYISELTKLFRALLQVKQSRVQLSTFDAIEFVLHKFTVPLHTTPEGDGFCEMLSYELLGLANSTRSTLRDHASGLFYLLLRMDYEVHGSLSRTSTMSTVSVSKIVGGREQRTEDVVRTNLIALRTSLKGILDFSGGTLAVKEDVAAAMAEAEAELVGGASKPTREVKRERRRTATMVITPDMIAAARVMNARNTTGLDREIHDLVGRLGRLADYSSRLADSEGDAEALSELYLNISRDYADSPDLRVRWLDNLASFHATNKNYIEAVQCKVFVAVMIEHYLRNVAENRRELLLPCQYEALAPNVTKHLSAASMPSSPAVFQNFETWQASGVVRYLREVAELLEFADAHELCLEAQSLLVVVLKELKNYRDLSNTLDNFKGHVGRLIEAAAEVRAFAKYYRVSFFGILFEELDGLSYVYKVNGGMKLGKFQDQLRGQYANRVDGDSGRIEMLQNKDVSADMDPEKLYIQIGSVQPYFESSETWKRGTEHERSYGIDKFIFEAGMATTGKNVAASIAEQKKKKKIFTVEEKFPSLNTRLRVIRTEDVIISPLENAIELLEGRNTTIRSILNANPPRMNAVHQVLSGSVAVVVNEGPLAVAEAFLKEGAVGMDGEPYDRNKLDKLQVHISEFLRLCAFALKLSASLISEEHIPFQKHCEGKYEELKTCLGEYL